MRNKQIIDDIEDELKFHLDMRVAENIASGMTIDEAKRDAQERFGDLENIRAACLSNHHDNRVGPVLWFLRCLGVAGIAIWAGRLSSTFNALGQMIAISSLLAMLLLSLRVRTRQITSRTTSSIQGETGQDLLRVDEPSINWQLAGAALLLLLVATFGIVAIIGFSQKFLHL